MMKAFRIIPALIVLCLIWGCSEESGKIRKPRHSGESGEIIVIMDEGKWLSTPGDSLRAVLEASYPHLPQAEPQFKLLQFSPNEMSGLLQHHRNILKIVIGPDAEGENKLTLTKDKWSNQQLYFSATATDEENFYMLLRTEFQELIKRIDDMEVKRYQSKYYRTGNETLEEKVKELMGVELALPVESELAEVHEDFIWIERERIKYLGNNGHDITQGFFIYRYPYTSDSLLEESAILAKRDEFLKKYVPGPKEGTYMTTEYKFPPSSTVTSLNDKYAVETRGLWKTANYFMGGPFISLTTTSADDQYVVCISAFTFAPKFNKREYIRESEAILYSAKIQ